MKEVEHPHVPSDEQMQSRLPRRVPMRAIIDHFDSAEARGGVFVAIMASARAKLMGLSQRFPERIAVGMPATANTASRLVPPGTQGIVGAVMLPFTEMHTDDIVRFDYVLNGRTEHYWMKPSELDFPCTQTE